MLSLLLVSRAAQGQSTSPLAARGYSVLPVPQKVLLNGPDFEFGERWQLRLESGVKPDDDAIKSLTEGLQSRFHLKLATSGTAGLIHLRLAAGSVAIGEATDSNRPALAEQAYHLVLKPQSIDITANAPPGLYYGVQTVMQLITPREHRLWLPEGDIVDWPDLELRVIYWDDAHHLEHLDVLKQAIRQAAFYKINGFAIKLEGHFQYKSAPAIVEPYAMTPAELQELTDEASRCHVQLIPYLDAPGHVAFILKHPEYAPLRAFPGSNYEFCSTNPETYKLLYGMYDDLLAANQGGKYFVLSTDEPYYVGLASNSQCEEAARAKELGSVGKLLAEFVNKTANYLHERGRTVIFWGEYPLKPADLAALPSHLVNGEVYGPDFDPVFKQHGIRQMVYTSTEGEEPLFPDYYILSSTKRLHPSPARAGRVREMYEHISFTPARQQADLMGAFIAGWADPGLHPETFWLGYATGPAAAWRAGSVSPSELVSSFYRQFYGPNAQNVGRLYQLMSEQAQYWNDMWETERSAARTPIWGNSDQIFNPPRPANDQALPPLPVPSGPLLALDSDWAQLNAKRLQIAGNALEQNDELLDLLRANLVAVDYNRYNLEVLISIAELCRQNLEMILNLGRISELMKAARGAAGAPNPTRAVTALDAALDAAAGIHEQRNLALHNTVATWYKSWYPRVAAANGRGYLDQVDDVKDHHPVRTVDMSYLIYRELLYPLGQWATETLAARNEYARAHNLPARSERFDWKDTVSLHPVRLDAE
jgi:hypothetical protein